VIGVFADVVDRAQEEVIEEVALALGVVGALDGEPEQPVDRRRLEIHSEQHYMRAGDGLHADGSVSGPLSQEPAVRSLWRTREYCASALGIRLAPPSGDRRRRALPPAVFASL
jgi:hypothetical protein